MAFCIPRKESAAILQSLKAGDVKPADLIDMGSEGRRAFFAKHVGEDAAHEVNALFESKLVLKDQQRGMISWLKKLGGITEPVRKDFLDKVEKWEKVLSPEENKAFLEDLAAQKIGIAVTKSEAAKIVKGASAIRTLRDKGWNADAQKWSDEDARLKYGTAFVAYQDYVGGLLSKANSKSFREFLKAPSFGEAFKTMAGATKGIVASLDNSFFGRQGIKMLYTNPKIWSNAFLKSWGDIAGTIKGGDPMLAIRADVASRPNAMNGKYANAKIAIGIKFEEAMPSNLPEHIPVFGRLYKASEVAYNGGALRLRADYADKMIAAAEKFGVDMKHGKQAEGIGFLINSMTGRGSIGRLEQFGAETNALFFSIKFFKSNLDTLTGHRLGYAIEAGPARDFVRQESAKNLAKIVGSTAAILFTAENLWPGSVDWDPRSSNFGKIKIGNTRFDITGGMGSIAVLAGRVLPSYHNGKLSSWSKSSTSGKFSDLESGKYGASTGLDVVNNFWEGKLSPLAGVIRDALAGQQFGGGPVTLKGEALNMVIPMGVQNFQQTMADPDHANILATTILDGLGISTSTYSKQSMRQQRRASQ